jgi:uncharacterized membrane protein YozB (DUF420 family)
MGFFRNRALLLAIFSSIALHALILYQPFLASVFHVSPLSLPDWILIIVISLSVFFVVELIKLIGRKWLKWHKDERL